MRNRTRQNMASVGDLNWAAGFIDGEGHINCRDSLRIKVTQAERGPLDRLQAIFPGTRSKGPYKQKRAPYSGSEPYKELGPYKVYHWDAYGKVAAKIMMSLYRFMWHEKRKKQVRDALAQWDPHRFCCPKGHPYMLTFYESPTCSTHGVHYLGACPRCGSKGRLISSPGAIRCAPSKSSGAVIPRPGDAPLPLRLES